MHQHIGISHYGIDIVYAGVQIVLNHVKVAIVAVGDLGRNVALGDPINIVGCHVERPNNGVKGVIDAFDDPAIVALVFRSVRSSCQFAIDSSLGQHVGVSNQRIDFLNTIIQVVLNHIEVAVVAVSNLRRNIALGDPVNIVGCHVKRPNNRVQRVINAFDDPPEVALVLRSVRSSS